MSMRVYTRVVWQWEGGVLVEKEATFYDYDGPVALAKATAVLSQTHFRFRSDTGTVDAAATWLANEDTNISVDVSSGNVTLRLRVTIQESGGATGQIFADNLCSLRTSLDTYAAAITTSSSKLQAADAGSSADETSLTVKRLSGTGTFANGAYDETGTTPTVAIGDINISANGNTELEFGIKVVAADVSNGETIDFRVYNTSGDAISSWPSTPRITVVKGSTSDDKVHLRSNPLLLSKNILTRRGIRGAQLEFDQPLPLMILRNQDGAGTATGDSTASGTLDAFADFAGSATGDSTASGSLTALGDFAGTATGDSTASGSLSALADFAGTAAGDATASGDLTALADFAGTATGDAIASAQGEQEGEGAATGDAVASGTLDAFANFAGTATGDAVAAGDLTALGDFAGTATGDAIASAEGSSANLQDTDGTATGDSVASGALDAFGDFAGTATGDSIASAQGENDAAGAATGDSVATGSLDAFGDFAGTATGDAIASGDLTALGDFAGTATGDAIASGTLDAFGDFAGTATGDSVASGDLTALADFAGTAVGDAIASAEGTSENLQDTDGTAIGDSVASGDLDALADFDGTATGDSIALAEGDFTTVAAQSEAPIVTNLGVGSAAWRNHYRSSLPRKKKKKLDELDEMIAALQERIGEIPPQVAGFDEDAYERTLRVSQSLAERGDLDQVTDARIGRQIAQLKEAIEELDDEEAIILALA